MQPVETASPPATGSTGGLWIVLGLLASLGSLVGVCIQFLVLKQAFTPWYAAGLATLGVALLAIALFRRMSLPRGLLLAVFAGLAALEWYILLVVSLSPAYAGPTRGEQLPAFAATLSDGSPFTEQDLRENGPSILLFYRGHW